MPRTVCRNTAMADALFRAGIGVQLPKKPEPVDSPALPRQSVDAVILDLAGPGSSLFRRRDRALLTLRELAEKVAENDARTQRIRRMGASA